MAEDIAQWLDGHGLGQYAQAFAENRIELDILPDLSDSAATVSGATSEGTAPSADRRRTMI